MSEKPAYIIVEAPSLDRLRAYVNEAVRDGYVPVGGVAVLDREGRYEYGSAGLVAQAMVVRGLVIG